MKNKQENVCPSQTRGSEVFQNSLWNQKLWGKLQITWTPKRSLPTQTLRCLSGPTSPDTSKQWSLLGCWEGRWFVSWTTCEQRHIMRARKKLSLVQWASESSAFLVQLYSTCPLGELKKNKCVTVYRLSRKKCRGVMYFLNVYLSKGQVFTVQVVHLPTQPCRTAHWKNWTSSIVWIYFGNIVEKGWKIQFP